MGSAEVLLANCKVTDKRANTQKEEAKERQMVWGGSHRGSPSVLAVLEFHFKNSKKVTENDAAVLFFLEV